MDQCRINDEFCTKPGAKTYGIIIKGLCQKHYFTARRHGGDPLAGSNHLSNSKAFVPRDWLQAATQAVTTASCLTWPFRTHEGYAVLGDNTSNRWAYRLAWEMYYQRPFPTDKVARHTCNNGNQGCVNPLHIVPGTPKQNSEDMVTAGRQTKGTKHWKAKLSEASVREIRHLVAQGVRKTEIAHRYNISLTHVYRVAKKQYWNHTTTEEE